MSVRTTLNTNKQCIYLCKKIDDLTWAEPVEIHINVMPVNANGEIMVYGIDFPQNLVCVCSNKIANNFDVGDRIYFKKTIPKKHNKLQNKSEDANFEVNQIPTISLNTSEIRFQYLKGR